VSVADVLVGIVSGSIATIGAVGFFAHLMHRKSTIWLVIESVDTTDEKIPASLRRPSASLRVSGSIYGSNVLGEIESIEDAAMLAVIVHRAEDVVTRKRIEKGRRK